MTALATKGITSPWGHPFFTGTVAVSEDVPGIYPIGLNGRGFLLDLASNEYAHTSVPLLRQQADQSREPGESSVNPDDLWRRFASTWHLGAGQRILDATESTAGRFHTSKGIDPWTNGQFSLLPDTDQKVANASGNLQLEVAGDALYLLVNDQLWWTADITDDTPAWSTVSGMSATVGTDLTSDGHTIWTAHAADGVYETTREGATTAKSVTGTVTGLRYLKGRLFGFTDNTLYNITDTDTGTPDALPTALLDHPNSDFVWVDVAEAGDYFYPAGFSGDRSLIYSTRVQDDGTGMDVPRVAAELPHGEVLRGIYGYLGFLVIGTDKGIRFGETDAQGNVVLGGLIEDATSAQCFEGQGSFVWFGWSRYDGTSTGLGRLDLGAFNGTEPAYASDLMVTSQADVTSVVTFQGLRVFTVAGLGVYAEDSDLVASGTLDLGKVGYGIYDNKVSMFLNVNHEPLAGAVSAAIAKDHGEFASIGVEQNFAGSVRSDFPTNRARGQSFGLRLTLTRDAVTTTGPTITFVTLRSFPSASRTERITIPLLLGRNQKLRNGSTTARDTSDDLLFLAALEADGGPIRLQEGRASSVVVLEDHQWRPHHFENHGADPTGTYLAQFKRFSSE